MAKLNRDQDLLVPSWTPNTAPPLRLTPFTIDPMEGTQSDLRSMEAIIRPGIPKDAEAAARLFQAHLNWINVWYEPHEVVQRKSSVRRITASIRDHYPSAMAVANDVVVGFAVSEMRDPNVLEIINLYVDDPYRRKGFGSRLIETVCEQALGNNVHTVMACASSYYFPGKTLPEGIYRRLGFEVFDLAPGAQMYVKRIIKSDRKKVSKVRRLRMSSTGEVDRVPERSSGE